VALAPETVLLEEELTANCNCRDRPVLLVGALGVLAGLLWRDAALEAALTEDCSFVGYAASGGAAGAAGGALPRTARD